MADDVLIGVTMEDCRAVEPWRTFSRHSHTHTHSEKDSECSSGQVMEAVRNCDITAVSGLFFVFLRYSRANKAERRRKIIWKCVERKD